MREWERGYNLNVHILLKYIDEPLNLLDRLSTEM